MTTAWLHNGNGTMFIRIGMLVLQGVLAIGLFWAGATFVHKSDFDAYKTVQEERRYETFKAINEIAGTMGKINQRMEDAEKGKSESKR